MYKNFQQIVEAAVKRSQHQVCVAAAEDAELLRALKTATDMKLTSPVLTGDESRLKELAQDVGLSEFRIIDSGSPEESAAAAVAFVRKNAGAILMKGLVSTSTFMKAVLSREHGLRSGRLLSLLAVYELPQYHKLLYCTDSGINAAPDLQQKKDIINNALQAMSSMGIIKPKTAMLAASEVVDEKIKSTIDAHNLVLMTGSKEVLPCQAEGPIAFDVAFDRAAAAHKGIVSQISGDVDLLLFPNMETGNALGKSWLLFNKASWAGIVLGATAPIILGSRSDTAKIKINSIALGCLAAGGNDYEIR